MFKKLAEGLSEKFKINANDDEIEAFIVNFFDEAITLFLFNLKKECWSSFTLYECDEFFKMVNIETKKHSG